VAAVPIASQTRIKKKKKENLLIDHEVTPGLNQGIRREKPAST
jgi:hypothetical protein